jgi:hypothetical protein
VAPEEVPGWALDLSPDCATEAVAMRRDLPQ